MKLVCRECGKDMGVLRDATVRNGMTVYCAPCESKIRREREYARPPSSHGRRMQNASAEDAKNFINDFFGTLGPRPSGR